MEKVKVLFVCMGNICRSPTAHGVFEQRVKERGLADRIYVDSAGTHAYHVGEQPDSRSQATALTRGFDLSYQRARKVALQDFDDFDFVLAMDKSNLRDLHALASPKQRQRVALFLDYAERWDEQEVPDPYYGGSKGFDRVFDMVDDASEGLLAHIMREYRF